MSVCTAVACVTMHNHDHQRKVHDNFVNYDVIRKCGEIFYHKTDTNLTITLHCITCKLICNTLEDFVEHIKKIQCGNECSNDGNGKFPNYRSSSQAKAVFINKKYNSDTEYYDEQENVVQNISEKSTFCDSSTFSSIDYTTIYNNGSTTTAYYDDYSEQSINTCPECKTTSEDVQSIVSLTLNKNSLCKHCPKMFKSKSNSHLHRYNHDKKIGSYMHYEMKSNTHSKKIAENSGDCRSAKTQVEKCINDVKYKSLGGCAVRLLSDSISSLNEYCSLLSDFDNENNLYCKKCDRCFQKCYQLKIHKMIAHKDLPRIINGNSELSHHVKNTCDGHTCSYAGQIIVPSIKNFHRRKNKNLTVKFLEPIMQDLSKQTRKHKKSHQRQLKDLSQYHL